jgi:hypothetical protein
VASQESLRKIKKGVRLRVPGLNIRAIEVKLFKQVSSIKLQRKVVAKNYFINSNINLSLDHNIIKAVISV